MIPEWDEHTGTKCATSPRTPGGTRTHTPKAADFKSATSTIPSQGQTFDVNQTTLIGRCHRINNKSKYTISLMKFKITACLMCWSCSQTHKTYSASMCSQRISRSYSIYNITCPQMLQNDRVQWLHIERPCRFYRTCAHSHLRWLVYRI